MKKYIGKMECEHKNLNQQQFDEKTKIFKTRKELYFFT